MKPLPVRRVSWSRVNPLPRDRGLSLDKKVKIVTLNDILAAGSAAGEREGWEPHSWASRRNR
jgi:hypothetical protein